MKRIVVLVFVSFFATIGTFAQNQKSDPCKDLGHTVNAAYNGALGAVAGGATSSTSGPAGVAAGAAIGAVAGVASYTSTTDRSSNPSGHGGDVTKACKDGGWFNSPSNNGADKSNGKSGGNSGSSSRSSSDKTPGSNYDRKSWDGFGSRGR